MTKMSIYDWNCAELIHSYVGANYNDFCMANIEDDVSELEFTIGRFADFKDWSSAYGYEITKER